MACCWTLLGVGLVIGIIVFHTLCRYLSRVWRMTDAELKGKTVLITGCDSGFGLALSKQLAKKGVKVFSACLTEPGKAALADVENIDAFMMDVTKKESVLEGVKYVKERAPNGLWALLNNAGVLRGGLLETAPDFDWKLQFDVNVIGMAMVTKYSLPLLRACKGSRVINISSVAGRFAMGSTSAYSASKFAVQGLSDALRRELLGWGIKVIIVEPGVARTPLWDAPFDQSQYFKNFEDLTPDIQELYGRPYFEKSYEGATKLIEKLANPPELIVDTLDEAMTTKLPLTRYSVGRDAPMWLCLAYMPTWISDLLIYLDSRKNLPAALQPKKKNV